MLPVTIVGGYLGAGKTTLLNHLLRHADGLRIGVLVNEFGALPIDEDLIEAQDDDIISIAGGCVCCSFGNDLTAALQDMMQMTPPPDHVVIESSGVAIPGAIAAAVSLLDGVRTDGIVILADAETIQRSANDKYMGDTVLRQLSDADIIILNKTDLIAEDKVALTADWLQDKTAQALLIRATQGAVAPDILLGSYLGRAHTPGPHMEAASLQVHLLSIPAKVDSRQLARSLADPNSGLVRAKGFVTDLDGTVQLVQVVGRRWEVTPAGAHLQDGIVCLGFAEQINRDALDQIATEDAAP